MKNHSEIPVPQFQFHWFRVKPAYGTKSVCTSKAAGLFASPQFLKAQSETVLNIEFRSFLLG
jgi:hypothetical protein